MSVETVAPAVVDASIVVKWLLPEPDSESALAQRQTWKTQGLVPAAPDFLLIELHNVLWKKSQRGGLASDAPILSFSPLFGLDLTWFPCEPLLPLALSIALRERVSIYDALYASLAQQLRAPLYTADTVLAERLSPSMTVHTLAPPARQQP